jgi:PAS domain S-box-containing protein
MVTDQFLTKDKYKAALAAYLDSGDESALQGAYEFGRNAVAVGGGSIAIIVAHQEAFAELLLRSKSPAECGHLHRLASGFLLESLSPVEMSYRGYSDSLRTLRRSEERYRQLIESARDFIFTLAADGTIKTLNHVFETLTGLKAEQWKGKPFQLILHPDDASILVETLRRVMSGETLPLFELRIRLEAGGYVVGEFTTAPEYDDGDIVGAFGIARDITERKNVQYQLKSLAKRVIDAHEEERRRLARELHDDLCQWLSGTKMTVGLLEDSLADNKVAKKKMCELKNQINDRIIEVRRMSVTLRPSALDDFGMATALGRLCEDYQRIYDIEVSFIKADLRRERYVSEIEVAMYRIAQEALSNIVRHAHAGHAKVCLRETSDELVVELADDGVGFDVTAVRTDRPPESGMGMVSMRERTKLLGGTFQIKSTPGLGTTVRAEIPFLIPSM